MSASGDRIKSVPLDEFGNASAQLTDRLLGEVPSVRAFERKRATSELDGVYRQLFETTGDGILIARTLLDDDNVVVDAQVIEANRAARELVATDLAGRSFADAGAEWSPPWANLIHRFMPSETPALLETYSAQLDRWVEMRIAPLPPPQHRVAITLRDITDRKTTEAALAAELDAMDRLQELGTQASDAPDFPTLLNRILDATMRLQHADFGNIQIYVPETGMLRIEAHRGFAPPFIDRFGLVSAESDPVFGRMNRGEERFVVEDIEHDRRCEAMLPAARAASFRAMQSTPLVSTSGKLLGMLSTYFREPRRWADRELRHIALIARQAANAIEHTRADESLRASEARARHALEVETVGVVFHGADGRVRDANDAFLHMTGHTRRDLAEGKLRWSALTPPEWLPATQAVADRLAANRHAAPYEREYVRKDGSRWWGFTAPKRLEGDATVEFVLDVTAKRRTMEALRVSQERFRAVANLVPELLWRNDSSGKFVWFNKRWFEYTGLADGLTGGPGWLDVIHPDDRDAFQEGFRSALQSGFPLLMEQRIRRSDGAYRWFLIRAVPIRDDRGQVTDWFGSATDVHDERSAREVLEASVEAATLELHMLSRRLLTVQEEERRHLARELHDEIGQVLTGLGFQLSGNSIDQSRLAEARQIVQDLTNHVRGLSMELRPAALDKFGLLPALCWHVERYTDQTGIEVDLRSEGAERRFSAPLEIAAFRIAQEALTNIARHSGTRQAFIRIYADASVLTVSIRDEGRGFQPGTVIHSGGTSGMRERAELVGGALTIDAGLGEGVMVTAELPIDDTKLTTEL